MSVIDSMLGNDNTKIIKLLDLLKKQLDRMESSISAIEDYQLACIGEKDES